MPSKVDEYERGDYMWNLQTGLQTKVYPIQAKIIGKEAFHSGGGGEE